MLDVDSALVAQPLLKGGAAKGVLEAEGRVARDVRTAPLPSAVNSKRLVDCLELATPVARGGHARVRVSVDSCSARGHRREFGSGRLSLLLARPARRHAALHVLPTARRVVCERFDPILARDEAEPRVGPVKHARERARVRLAHQKGRGPAEPLPARLRSRSPSAAARLQVHQGSEHERA